MDFDFSRICKENGIPTRIVFCSFGLEYDEVSQQAQEEYLRLGDAGYDSFGNWLENLKLKNKNEDQNPVVLEILVHIYRKLDTLEKIIRNEEKDLFLLKNKSFGIALGHGVVCVQNQEFQVQKDYYLRLQLPVFPQRSIGVFGQAFDKRIVKITKMHQKDIEDFDMYIANKEIENLRTKNKDK